MTNDPPLLLSISEAACLLGLTKAQLYELTRYRSRNKQIIPIPHVRLGKRLAFRKESLERWVLDLEAAVDAKQLARNL